MTLQGVLFDKDGTLLKFAEVWGEWCEQLVKQLAPDNTALQRKLALAVGYQADTKSFVIGSPVVNASADETAAIWAGHVNLSVEKIEQIGLSALENLPLIPVTDLNKVFTELKSFGLKIGLATNDYEAVAHQQLNALSVAHYFDFVCGFDSGYGSKPEPGMIEAFCTQTRCAVDNVAMVGDSTHDLHAAGAAGAGLLVGVLTGPAQACDLENDAHLILPDIADLPAALQQRGLV